MRAPRKGFGFSLIELLVVIAIISILLGMYMSTFSKALSKARQVAAKEGMHQSHIGRLADDANSTRHDDGPADRAECRAAYREPFETGSDVIHATRLLYRVTNDDEFRAYWHTLISASASDPLEYAANGDLVARDEFGNVAYLTPLDPSGWDTGRTGVVPFMWEFLSTNMGEMDVNDMGIEVLYSDGHVEHLPYRFRFPASPLVAELSHRFYIEAGL